MRKGFTLVEIMVVIAILPFVLAVVYGLFATLLTEIPWSYRIAQESMTLQNLLEQMQQDMDEARRLPESFAGQSASDQQVLIELPEGVISYQRKDGQIVRRKLIDAEQGNTGDERVWSLPNANVEWQMWAKNGRGYAVEMKTHIEYRARGRWKETMANSHLYYRGLLR